MSRPIGVRVPNPPALLAGREAVLTLLRRSVSDGSRAIVVTGPGGIGKTAVLLALVDGHPDIDRDRCLYVSLRDAPPDDPFRPILRGLANVVDVPARELAGVRDPDEQMGRALDLADAAVDAMVVDDVQHVRAGTAARVVDAVAAHARRARWLFASRRAIPTERVGLSTSLGPLDADSLNALATRWAPHLDASDHARAARASRGSPWRLARALRGELERGSLEPALAHACALLALLEGAVPPDALGLDDAVLDELLERGLAVRRGRRVVLHEAARDELAGAEPPVEAARALLERLAASNDTALEAIRIAQRLGDGARAAALLERRAAALLEAGYAPELSALVRPDAAPPLEAWGMRLAAEAGDPALLDDAVAPPPDASLDARYAYYRVRQTREDHTHILASYAALSDELRARGDRYEAARVELEAAGSAMLRGEGARAAAILDACEPRSDVQVLQVRAVRAMLAAFAGERDAAAREVEVLVERLDTVAGPDRASLTYNAGLILYWLGRPIEAATLFESTFPEDALATAALLSRRATEVYAQLSVQAGRLDRAERLLERLGRFAIPGSAIEGRTKLIAGSLAMLRGRHEEADRLTARGREAAEGYAGIEDLAFAATQAALLAWRRGAAPAEVELPETPAGQVASAWRVLATWAHTGDPAPSVVGDGPELEELSRLAAAATALDAGDASIARALPPDLSRAQAAAPHRAAWASFSAALRCAAGGAPQVTDVHAWAESIGAWDVAGELGVLLAVERRDVRALLSSSHGLAQQVLGAACDGHLRGQLVAGLCAQLGWERARGAAWSSEVTLMDAPRGTLFHPRGGEARLRSGSVPSSILRELAGSPSGLSKEELVLRVWRTREYHPLRHDNRLRVAVRKLRKRWASLEDVDPVRTLEDGYALARPVRWLESADD